jgi:hypothetical protein
VGNAQTGPAIGAKINESFAKETINPLKKKLL